VNGVDARMSEYQADTKFGLPDYPSRQPVMKRFPVEMQRQGEISISPARQARDMGFDERTPEADVAGSSRERNLSGNHQGCVEHKRVTRRCPSVPGFWFWHSDSP